MVPILVALSLICNKYGIFISIEDDIFVQNFLAICAFFDMSRICVVFDGCFFHLNVCRILLLTIILHVIRALSSNFVRVVRQMHCVINKI